MISPESKMLRELRDQDNIREEMETCRAEVDAQMIALSQQVAEAVEARQTLVEIQHDVAHMREIIEAWNNAKGFVATIRFLASVVKWTAVIGSAVGLVWYVLKYGAPPPPSN